MELVRHHLAWTYTESIIQAFWWGESCRVLLVVAGRFAVILFMFSSGFKWATNFTHYDNMGKAKGAMIHTYSSFASFNLWHFFAQLLCMALDLMPECVKPGQGSHQPRRA